MSINRLARAGLISAGAIAASAAAAAFLCAPGRIDRARRAPFMGRNYAHRGLHRIDKSTPENSVPAFEHAHRIGYGVELDVHITADGGLVVFHDDDTERMCGVPGRVEDMTLAELKALRLAGTDYAIPTLAEALEACGGSPLIVELKRGGRNKELCRKVYEAMRGYPGPWCVESFDPKMVFWFRLHAPEVVRGQLSTRYASLRKSCSPVSAFILSRCLTNVLARPHFIAYEIGRRPLTVKLAAALGAMRVAWTSLEWKTEERADAVIFQFYRPRVKYK